MLVAAGISMHIGAQAFLNIMVACNAFPNTGISLPFFSYGGTSLLIQHVEVGILLNISRQAHLKK
jgi:cell division protein FtsW